MSKYPSQSALKSTSGLLSPLGRLRQARDLLKQVNLLLSTPDGAAIRRFCKQNRTYVPLSPAVMIGESFSDGHSAGAKRVQLIAVAARGLLVLSSYKTIEPVYGDMLAFPTIGALPVLKTLHLLMALGPASAAGFSLEFAKDRIKKGAQMIKDGATAFELRTIS